MRCSASSRISSRPWRPPRRSRSSGPRKPRRCSWPAGPRGAGRLRDPPPAACRRRPGPRAGHRGRQPADPAGTGDSGVHLRRPDQPGDRRPAGPFRTDRRGARAKHPGQVQLTNLTNIAWATGTRAYRAAPPDCPFVGHDGRTAAVITHRDPIGPGRDLPWLEPQLAGRLKDVTPGYRPNASEVVRRKTRARRYRPRARAKSPAASRCAPPRARWRGSRWPPRSAW